MSIKLPYQQTKDRQFNQFQSALSAALQPLTSVPMSESVILKQVSLQSGLNVIPTTLNRNLQGWYPIRVRSAATLFDTQDANPTPSQTLYLNASASAVVDLVVF